MARFNLTLRRSGGSRPKQQNANRSRADVRAALTKLRTLLRRRWQLVAVLGAVASGALWWLAVAPAGRELQQVRAEAVVAERRASNLLKEFQTLQSAEGAAAASNRYDRAESLDDLLPNSLKNLEMLEAVQTIAEAAGLELGPSSPAPAAAAGPADKLEFYVFNVTVKGEFPQIVDFIEGLTEATPLVTVNGATFAYTAANPEANIPATVEFTAELRFWSSALKTLREIKADLDAAKAEAGDSPVSQSPASTQAPQATQNAPASTAPATTPATTAPSEDSPSEESPDTTAP